MEQRPITANDAGQRLDKYFQKIFPALPKSMIYKMIRKKDIRLNGKRTEASIILTDGDLVEYYLHTAFQERQCTDFSAISAQVTIVFEDPNILVLNKASGLLMHPGNEKSSDTLIHQALHYLNSTGAYNPGLDSFTPAFCNRLDRNTSGLVLLAKNFPTLQLLNEKIRQREIIRKYFCVAEGHFTQKEALLTAYLSKDSDANKMAVFEHPHENSRQIETKYRVLREIGSNTVLEIEIITGRSHQIRAQLAFIGHPIVGDTKYGAKRIPRQHQMLTAYLLEFAFQTPAKHLEYLQDKQITLDAFPEM